MFAVLLRPFTLRHLPVLKGRGLTPHRGFSWIKNWGAKRPWYQTLSRRLEVYGDDYLIPALIGANLCVYGGELLYDTQTMMAAFDL